MSLEFENLLVLLTSSEKQYLDLGIVLAQNYKDEFKDYFNRDYVKIQLLLVSQTEIYKRDLGLKMKALMNKKIVFRDKKYMITPKMPTPAVKPCYC